MSDLKDIKSLSAVDKCLPEVEQRPTDEPLEIGDDCLERAAGAGDGSAIGYGRY